MGNLACCQSTWCAQTQPYVFQRLWKEGGHGEEEKEKEVKKGVGEGGQICVLCSVATLSVSFFIIIIIFFIFPEFSAHGETQG